MTDSENPSAARQIKGVPAQPGEHCSTTSGEDWSEPEKWVWEQVCRGNIADFNEKQSRELDPATSDGWTEDREIRPSFLETILLHEPYRSALPRQGVRIIGAWLRPWLRDTFDLKFAVLDRVWWLDKSRVQSDVKLNSLKSSCYISFEESVFTGAVDLSVSQIGGQLNLDGAKFTGELNMNQIEVNGSLFMRKAEFKSGIDLIAAKVKGHLQMDGAKLLTGELKMGLLKVDGDLYIRKGAELSSVSMKSVQVGGQLDLSNANIGKLNMHSLDVTGPLRMEEAKFSEFELKGATVRHLYMSSAECQGELRLNSLSIKGSLRMNKARFPKFTLESATIGGLFDLSGAGYNGEQGPVNMYGLDLSGDMLMTNAEFPCFNLTYARIGGCVDISGGEFTSMDLTGSSIKTVLRMGPDNTSRAKWSGKSSLLLLRNTVVDTVQAPPDLDAFPKKLDLNGFKYTHLGEAREEEREKLREDDSDMGSRKPRWFTDWLKRNRSYSPQPYLQLAEVLRNMGHPVKADAILFEGKKCERREIKNRGEKSKYAWLSVLEYTIGYGYRYLRTIPWVMVLTFIGALFFAGAYHDNSVNCETKVFEPIICQTFSWDRSLSFQKCIEACAFSLDLLLPIVKLNECHYKILPMLPYWARCYFYFHELLGYILGSFVIAGLSGITKK